MRPRSGFTVRRAYDPPSPADGVRVLVDRLWPRGLAKERAAVDIWLKEVTPSAELRRSYHRDELDFATFAERYRAELAGPAAEDGMRRLLDLARGSTVTLLTAVKDPEQGHVPVLVDRLCERSA